MKPREISARMKALRQTLAITQSMQTIAAAKIAPAQAYHAKALRYEQGLTEIFNDLGISNEYTRVDQEPKVALLTISSERGLCGGYNIGIRNHLAKMKVENVVKVFPIGRPVPIAALSDRVDERFLENGLKDPYEFAKSIFRVISEGVKSGEFNALQALSFDAGTQSVPSIKTIFPLAPHAKKKDIDCEIYDENAVTEQLITAKIYTLLRSSEVVEHTMRMTAMKLATSNGKEMLDEMQIIYQQTRQNEITSALNDAVNALRRKEI